MSYKQLAFPENSLFLVTGGAGFIGSNLCEAILNLGYRVRCLDDLSTGKQTNVDLFADNPNYEFVKGDMIKPGAAVIDVGINRIFDEKLGKNRLVGDVNFAEAVEVAGAITPVPGGVGPMTIAMLMRNAAAASEYFHKQNKK